jgi:hypothetical protein
MHEFYFHFIYEFLLFNKDKTLVVILREKKCKKKYCTALFSSIQNVIANVYYKHTHARSEKYYKKNTLFS